MKDAIIIYGLFIWGLTIAILSYAFGYWRGCADRLDKKKLKDLLDRIYVTRVEQAENIGRLMACEMQVKLLLTVVADLNKNGKKKQ
jgi:hypothetical protein